MNHNAMRYKSKLKRRLQCNRATKAKLLDEFSHSLDGFLEENPDATFADLSNAFGPPEEMARILMAEISEEETRKYRLHVRFKRILAGFCAAAVLIFTFYVFFWKEKPINAIYSGEVIEDFEVTNKFEIVDSIDISKGE